MAKLPDTTVSEFEAALAEDAASVVLGEFGRTLVYYRLGREPGALAFGACFAGAAMPMKAPSGNGIQIKPAGDLASVRTFAMLVQAALPGATDNELGTDAATPDVAGGVITLAAHDQFDVPGMMVGRPAEKSVRVRVTAARIVYTPGLWQCEVTA